MKRRTFLVAATMAAAGCSGIIPEQSGDPSAAPPDSDEWEVRDDVQGSIAEGAHRNLVVPITTSGRRRPRAVRETVRKARDSAFPGAEVEVPLYVTEGESLAGEGAESEGNLEPEEEWDFAVVLADVEVDAVGSYTVETGGTPTQRVKRVIRSVALRTRMEAYELISRNAVEVVTQEEVRELAESPEGERAYVGYEPSGVLHLGHMLTANKLIDLQDAGMEVVILLADVHAYLNDKGTFEEIRATAERMREQFLAYGLDEDATEFVLGSEFQLDEDYVLDLHSLAVGTTLNRARRAMAELQSGETAKVSHVVYPLMQALDIEYLDLDLAVGGLDQRKVHMLHREELPALGYEARPAIHTPIIADLTTGIGKMSSSGNPVTGGESITLSFEDPRESIEEKVNGIFFPPERDPDFEDYYDPDDYGVDPDEVELHNPALQLFEYHVFPRFESVTVERPDEYGGDVTYESYESLAEALESGDLHPADAKSALASYLDELIAPGREEIRAARE